MLSHFDMAIILIKAERERQARKWGANRKMNDFSWLTIICEEIGEIAKAILQNNTDNIYKEIIHAAAVAVAWLECFIEYGDTRKENSDFKYG